MMTYEVVLTESYQPTEIGRAYTAETVVKAGLTYEDARREALMCNTKAFSNQYYSFRVTK
jgi:ribosomal protein L13E